MKSIDDALELRGRIFGAFELAELAEAPAERERALTFVVVGAGPTGVEMAGQIAELAHRTLKNDFRRIDPTQARIILVDAVDTVLPSFGERLGGAARRRLHRDGGRRAAGHHGHRRRRHRASRSPTPDGSSTRIEALTKVWAAGVQASPLGGQIAEQSGAATRPRRARPGAARPHRAGSPRGVRGRRHDVPRQAARSCAGRHPGRPVRREADHPPPRRPGDRAALRVLRQGLDGHDLAVQRGGRRSGGCASPVSSPGCSGSPSTSSTSSGSSTG